MLRGVGEMEMDGCCRSHRRHVCKRGSGRGIQCLKMALEGLLGVGRQLQCRQRDFVAHSVGYEVGHAEGLLVALMVSA